MAVTSFAPLVDRIYEALTTSTGQARALATADQMKRGYPPAEALLNERALIARDALSAQLNGACFVLLGDKVAERDDPELGSEHLYRVTIQVSRDYYLGHWLTSTQLRSTGLNEIQAALTKIDDHFPKIRAALGYPNAHALVTQTGAETGLATGSLIGSLARSGAPQLSIVEGGGARLVNVIDTFAADVIWNPG